MNKIYECFCGFKFHEPFTFYKHCQSCQVYNDFKNKYLTYDSFYKLYMIDRKFYKEFLIEFPFNKFCLKDIVALKRLCNFPKLIKTKTNQRFTHQEINNILNYDFLYDRYIIKQMNASEICQELNCGFDHSAVLNRLVELGIPKRSRQEIFSSSRFRSKISKAIKSEEVQNKLKLSCMKHFGVDNPLKCKEIKDKAINTCLERYGSRTPYECKKILEKGRQTCLQRYGVDNPFKSKEIQEKFKETCRQKYGVDWPFQCKEIQEKATYTSLLNDSGYSKMAVDLFNEISNHYPNINSYFKYATHGNEICEWNNDTFKSYFLDFSYNQNGIKFDIEFNGDYFHANPKFYQSDDILKLEGKLQKAKDIWKYDELRIEFLKSLGYKILIVWEYDYIHNHNLVFTNCIDFINNCLGTI